MTLTHLLPTLSGASVYGSSERVLLIPKSRLNVPHQFLAAPALRTRRKSRATTCALAIPVGRSDYRDVRGFARLVR
jgi:hypothetical protein